MKTPYELEAQGWKINQIYQSAYENGNHDYSIFHAFFFPFGHVLSNTTLKAALEFCNDRIKEDQHKEEVERINLDR